MARLQKKLSAADKQKKKEQSTEAASIADEDKVSSEAPKASAPTARQESKTPEKRIKPAVAASTVPEGERNWFQKAVQFFREVKVELKKVTWPSRKQAAGSTLVVIILVFILATFLGLVDFGLSKLVQVVLA